MTHTRRQALLVFALPLAVAVGVTSLLELRDGAARDVDGAAIAVMSGADEAVELLDVRSLLPDAAAAASLEPALSLQPVSIEWSANERPRGETQNQLLPVPEPGSLPLLALGLSGLAARRRSLPRA